MCGRLCPRVAGAAAPAFSRNADAGQLDSLLRALPLPPFLRGPDPAPAAPGPVCGRLARGRPALLGPSLSQPCLERSIPNLHSAVPSQLLSIFNDRPQDAIGGKSFCGPF